MKKIIVELLIIVAVGVGIWLGISYLNVIPEKSSLISQEREQELGEKFLESFLEDPSMPQIINEEVDSLMLIMTDRLINAMDEVSYDYNFVVIDNSMINAFCMPGGNIVIFTGLIEFTDTPEELMAVIAHEIGHAELNHILARIVKQVGLEVLLSGDTFVFGEISKLMASTGFDRSQEKEADEFSCELLEKAKIEPRTLATLFRKMKTEISNETMEKFEMVASHPNFTSRIKDVLAYQPEEGFEADSVKIDWSDFKEVLQEANNH